MDLAEAAGRFRVGKPILLTAADNPLPPVKRVPAVAGKLIFALRTMAPGRSPDWACEGLDVMRAESKIVFQGSRVTKTFGENTEAEFEKSQRMWEISQKFGFLYPQPLSFNAANNTIDFALVPDTRSIRADYLAFTKARNPDARHREIFARAGEVLGIMHRELSVSKPEPWQPTQCFRRALRTLGFNDIEAIADLKPSVVLHGDYGLENVERVERDDEIQLAVFDASPNYFVTFNPFSTGPIYVDIGNFISVLHGLVPLRHHLSMDRKRSAELQAAFLGGYRKQFDVECDGRLVYTFAYASASCYLWQRLSKNHLQRLGKPYLHKLAMSLLFKHNSITVSE